MCGGRRNGRAPTRGEYVTNWYSVVRRHRSQQIHIIVGITNAESPHRDRYIRRERIDTVLSRSPSLSRHPSHDTPPCSASVHMRRLPAVAVQERFCCAALRFGSSCGIRFQSHIFDLPAELVMEEARFEDQMLAAKACSRPPSYVRAVGAPNRRMCICAIVSCPP